MRLVGEFRGSFYHHGWLHMVHTSQHDMWNRVHCAEKHICAPDLQLIHVDHTLALLGQEVAIWVTLDPNKSPGSFTEKMCPFQVRLISAL